MTACSASARIPGRTRAGVILVCVFLRALVAVPSLLGALSLAAPGCGAGDARTAAWGDVGWSPAAFAGPTGRRALNGPWVVRSGGETRREMAPFAVDPSQLTMPAFDGSTASFATNFAVPRGGDYAIRFESVNHRAVLRLDGRVVARHTGAYLPFDVRVPLTAGTHRLVVRDDWRDPDRMRAQGWH